MTDRDLTPESDLPHFLQSKPLEGKRLFECFSGNPSKGGACLSKVFEEAGGVATRYDLELSEAHDITCDGVFWSRQCEKPFYDVYHFAVPCTNFSIAHTTPRVRSKANPYGDESDKEVKHFNDMALYVISIVIKLCEKGCLVIVENPLFSYLWLFDEFRVLFGLEGMELMRVDYCGYGTPYQKMGMFVANSFHFAQISSVCGHIAPHPERLEGSKTRQSSPYPRELCFRIVESIAAALHDDSGQRLLQKSLSTSGISFSGSLSAVTARPAFTVDAYAELAPIGQRRISALRGGSAYAQHELRETLPGVNESMKPEDIEYPKRPWAEGTPEALKGLSSCGYERSEILRLTLQDEEFRDVVLVHDILNNKHVQNTSEAVFHAARQAIMKSGESNKRVASKRAQVAIRDKDNYHYDNDFLFRKVYDSMQEAFTYKLVIPSGGLRSFWYNGRKQRLSLRK